VSSRLILLSIHSACAQPRLMEYPRSSSSGAVSVRLLPSPMLPCRLLVPDTKARASTRLVLPLPPCPTTAMLRISDPRYSRIRLPRCGKRRGATGLPWKCVGARKVSSGDGNPLLSSRQERAARPRDLLVTTALRNLVVVPTGARSATEGPACHDGATEPRCRPDRSAQRDRGTCLSRRRYGTSLSSRQERAARPRDLLVTTAAKEQVPPLRSGRQQRNSRALHFGRDDNQTIHMTERPTQFAWAVLTSLTFEVPWSQSPS